MIQDRIDWKSQLQGFYGSIVNDSRISTTHISLYMALVFLCINGDSLNEVAFTSHEIMPLAKIDSRATYHKCLRDLVEFGYIGYLPSYNPFLKNLAYLRNKQ
jgi:hypothetical protein